MGGAVKGRRGGFWFLCEIVGGFGGKMYDMGEPTGKGEEGKGGGGG